MVNVCLHGVLEGIGELMMNKITLFEKDYDGESLYDLGRDISEAIDTRFNPLVQKIPTDEHGFQEGTFTVSIVWENDEEN